MGLADREGIRPNPARPSPYEVRRRAYLAAMLRAGALYRFADRVAPALGMSAQDLVEDGCRLWLRARLRRAGTRRQLWEFIAPSEDFPTLLAGLDEEGGVASLSPSDPSPAPPDAPPPAIAPRPGLASGPESSAGTLAQEGLATGDDAFALGCPRCGRVVRITLRDLVERRDVVCPAGHRVPLHACNGLDEVIGFLRDLVAVARRFPR